MKGNQLPNSFEAEKATLGGMLLDKNIAFEVLDYVKADDFYNQANREIFIAITELLSENIGADLITVCDRLKSKCSLEMAGGRAYIASILSEVPSIINTVEYAKVVAKKAVSRRLIYATEVTLDKAYKDSEDIFTTLEDAEKEILDIAQHGQKQNYHMISDILLENIKDIDKASRLEGGLPGISTGFKSLDKIINGLQPSNYIVVAARPSMGKTAFGLNIAENVSKAGHSVLFFSLEMSRKMLGVRLLASEARVDAGKLQTGNIDTTDWERLYLAIEQISSNGHLAIDDTSGISMAEMKNKCRRYKRDYGLDLVVIDYIGLMEAEGRSDNRQDEVRKLSMGMKQLAKELECPVIVLCQIKRPPEQGKVKRPQISELKESGAIEQDADIVIMLHRDDYYTKEESEKPGVCEVIVGKNRNGPTEIVELAWIARYTRFSEMAQ